MYIIYTYIYSSKAGADEAVRREASKRDDNYLITETTRERAKI